MKFSQHDSMLYVEDNEIDVENLSRALKACGINNPLASAGNGLEGLNYLKNENATLPKIIFLDLNMPIMNGFDFLSEIRKDPVLKKIPVFVLTTSSWDRDVMGAYEYNVTGYFVKPLEFKGLDHVVNAIKPFIELTQLPY